MKRNGKRTLIASIIALSLILTGIGYAYWTDTLNVTTRATTGELDVTFVDLGLYAQYGNETVGDGWSIVDGIAPLGYVDDMFFARPFGQYNKIARDDSINEYYERAAGWNNVEFDAWLVNPAPIKKVVGDYGTVAETNGSDNIVLKINNMYPGYAQAFRTDIINQGTIAAKLGNIKFEVGKLDEFELTEETKNMIGIAVLMTQDFDPSTPFKLCTYFADGDNYFTIGEIDFLRLSALEELEEADIIAAIEENRTILSVSDNSSRMDLFIGVAMDPDAEGVYTSGSTKVEGDGVDANSEGKGVEVSIDFAWDQFNEGVDAGTENILYKQNADQPKNNDEPQ